MFKEIKVQLAAYPQDGLVELFNSLKPHALQVVDLLFSEMPRLDLVGVVTELGTNAWASLQQINISWKDNACIDLASFFQSLDLLPALKQCDVHLPDDDFHPPYYQQPNNLEFLAVLTSLFKSDIKIKLTSVNGRLRGWLPDCRVAAQIRQLQQLYPKVKLDFYANNRSLLLWLSTGHSSFQEEVRHIIISNDHDPLDCLECLRFYPRVLHVLGQKADTCSTDRDVHLEDYQLNKCTIGTVVEHLNCKSKENRRGYKALTAEANDVSDLVTVSFEWSDDHDVMHHYKITVDCGPCFSCSCICCGNVQ